MKYKHELTSLEHMSIFFYSGVHRYPCDEFRSLNTVAVGSRLLVVQPPVRTRGHKDRNIVFLWRRWKAELISDQLLTPHLLSSLIFPHCLLNFIFCFSSHPPSPCNFFVQRIKFHLRGLWERRPLDWPLPVQMLLIYRAFLAAIETSWRDGWRNGGEEMGGRETCLYFLWIKNQMGALRGGLRSWPPWMAGKLTPIWLLGPPSSLAAYHPRDTSRAWITVKAHRQLHGGPNLYLFFKFYLRFIVSAVSQ